jgi:hypothetical protein
MGWRGVGRTSAIAAVVAVVVVGEQWRRRVEAGVGVVLANALGVVGRAAEQRRHACAGQQIGVVGVGAAMAGMWVLISGRRGMAG